MRDERPSRRFLSEMRETARNARNAWRASLLALRAMVDDRIRAIEREQARLRAEDDAARPPERERMTVEDAEAAAPAIDIAPPQMPQPEGSEEPPQHGIV